MTATERALTLAQTAAQAAADKLAKDILIIDVSDRLAITDCFVVVTGTNERQVSSIVDAVEEKMREAGEKPVRREGERDGRWVLLDFLDVVVHVQHSEERVFYALDRLWKDCPSIPFVDADAPAGTESAAPAVAPAAPEGTDSPAADLSAGAVTGDDLTVDGGLDADGLNAEGVRADGVRAGDPAGDAADDDLADDDRADDDAADGTAVDTAAVDPAEDPLDEPADDLTDETLDVADEAGDLAAGASDGGTEGAGSGR